MRKRKEPKPFFRSFTQTWYVQLGSKQINLGPDKEAAWDQYHDLMASRRALASVVLTAADFFEAYLEWVQENRAPATYDHARHYLTSFCTSIGKRKQLRHLTADNVLDWLSAHSNWSSTTQSDALSHLNRAFHWGIRKRLLRTSPVAELEIKPRRQRREVVYSPEQWDRVLAHVEDECFRDILTFLWETGCRPIEARRLEARHIDLTNDLAVLQPSETKTKQVRVIFLTDAAKAICQRLCERTPIGPIFRNSRGNPWTKDAIKCRFSRIKESAGLPGLCAYGIRHSFATEGLKNGVDSVALAVIMGHADVSMIARTYQHLAKDVRYLKEQAKKARTASA